MKEEPFYNPGMALNRDLSVLLVEAYAKRRGREIDVADALAGTGARTARLAHEVQAPLIAHGNDADPRAVAAQREAMQLNDIPASRMTVTEKDAHEFLASRRFDVVDLDPCGSPMPFIDAAMRAVRHNGLVCVTATDTGALAGTFPRVCRRRYDAHHGLHAMPWRAEVGARILAGAAIRSAARHERQAVPVLSVVHGHWMRVVVRVTEGKGDTDEGLRGLGYAIPTATSAGSFVPRPPPEGPYAGLLWTGALHDHDLVAGMQAAQEGKTLARPAEVSALLDRLAGEANPENGAFWVTPDRLHGELGSPPRRDEIIARLCAAGVPASRNHIDPQGVRTSATLDALARAWAAPIPSSTSH